MTPTRVLVVLGLTLFLGVDVVLVGLALRHTAPSGTSTSVLGMRTSAPPPSPSATPGTASPKASPAPRDRAQRTGPVLVSYAPSGAVAWARGGTCRGVQPVLRLSRDGTFFQRVDLPATSLLRVRSVSDLETWAIGTDDSCTPRFLRTVNGGRDWTTQPSTTTVWHLMPPPTRDVHAPDASVTSPCNKPSPTDLSVYSTTGAALLCPNGAVFVSGDGSSWSRAGAVTGAVALSFANASTAYAAAPGSGNCTGISVWASSDGGAMWRSRGCAHVATDVAVGMVFSSTKDGLLATPRQLLATTDSGKTWQSVSPP